MIYPCAVEGILRQEGLDDSVFLGAGEDAWAFALSDSEAIRVFPHASKSFVSELVRLYDRLQRTFLLLPVSVASMRCGSTRGSSTPSRRGCPDGRWGSSAGRSMGKAGGGSCGTTWERSGSWRGSRSSDRDFGGLSCFSGLAHGRDVEGVPPPGALETSWRQVWVVQLSEEVPRSSPDRLPARSPHRRAGWIGTGSRLSMGMPIPAMSSSMTAERSQRSWTSGGTAWSETRAWTWPSASSSPRWLEDFTPGGHRVPARIDCRGSGGGGLPRLDGDRAGVPVSRRLPHRAEVPEKPARDGGESSDSWQASWSSIHALRVQTTRVSTFDRERARWPISLSPKALDGCRPNLGLQRWGRERQILGGGHPSRNRESTGWPDGANPRPTAWWPSWTVSCWGLESSRPRERVTIVSDYLWTAYYINGWRRVHHPHLRAGVIRARSCLEQLKSAVFVHYVLETGGECAFRRWNAVAHDLCQESSTTSRGYQHLKSPPLFMARPP